MAARRDPLPATTPLPTAAPGEIPVSRLIAGSGPTPGAADWQVTRLVLEDGVEAVHWFGQFDRETCFALHDDSNRVHFSFTSRLDGAARCCFHDGHGRTDHDIQADAGCISFGRGHHGSYHQQGVLENVTVMVRPDILRGWDGMLDPALDRALTAERCFLDGHRGRDLADTAHGLGRGLRAAGDAALGAGTPALPSAARHPLWFRAQGLALVGLFLEARRAVPAALPSLSGDRLRLRRARDLLLADLSEPPGLPALARATGMSVTRLERGFRQLFGTSVYGLFQQERMADARRRLLDGGESVTRIAVELGYTNTSHFAAAFRKQYGVNPSALKRRG